MDRLLKSPANQRGRDFGVMLRCFHDLGYAVEWRVINAAEYGHVQRRRRIFIVAYRNTTPFFKNLIDFNIKNNECTSHEWLTKNGFFAPAFPVQAIQNTKKRIAAILDSTKYHDLASLSNAFKAGFYNSGVMIDGYVYSEETTPIHIEPQKLRDIRLEIPVDQKYFLNGSTEKWEYLKGSKKIPRIRPNGEPYFFSEGGMCFPDDIDLPARTMLTSESSVNRSTHVIEDYMTGKLRLLTPIECERINGFPDNWTSTDMPEKFRYFVMGNALVVPLITKIGNRLIEII